MTQSGFPKKPHKKRKSRGDGITSYRITSYLTLSNQVGNTPQSTQVSRESKNPYAQIIPPPKRMTLTSILGEGKTVATDNDPKPRKIPKYNFTENSQDYNTPTQPYNPVVQGKKLNFIINIIQKVISWKSWFEEKVMSPIKKVINSVNEITDNVIQVQEALSGWVKLFFQNMIKQIKNPITPIQQQIFPSEVPVEGEEPQYYQTGEPHVSFVDLYQLNIEFVDNYNRPLFDFSKQRNQAYQISSMVVDPIATQIALQAIMECASRASSIPPAMEGPYANIPLSTVLSNVTEDDLQAFLRYVKVYPGNYVGRQLKISETFATWVVYGAPSP